MDHFKNLYIEEASDLVADLEKCLIQIRNDLKNTELIGEIFRNMHSLKGGSSMVGFTNIAEFTHVFETLFVEIKSENIEFTKEILDLTLLAVDHIKLLIAKEDNIEEIEFLAHNKIISKIKSYLKQTHNEPSNQIINTTPEKISSKHTYFINFKPNTDVLTKGSNPLGVIHELTSNFENVTFSITNNIPDLFSIDAYRCYVSWISIIYTEQSISSIKDVFMFFEDDCKLEIEKISDKNLLKDADFINNLKEQINTRFDFSFVDLKNILSIKDEESSNNPVEINNKNELLEVENKNTKANIHSISSVRVSSDKLDKLINLVSELVTTQASLSLIAEKSGVKDILAVAEDIEKISRSLRDNTFSIRLVPLESITSRFNRMVIDLSRELNKEVNFETEGTETELDKTIIENLVEPIMHIIRNSMDHGIEQKEERIRKGKSENGVIRLKAFYSGANVHIQISDDGGGIDTQMIRQKAIAKGIIQSDTQISKQDLLDLIFLPGFSTSDVVTQVSGRGVGMDVVRRKISDIRGEISIDTKENSGTTITIKLPLTLSIIDGLLVLIDNTHYVIPLASVDRCFEFKHSYLSNAVNNMIFVNDGHIPIIYLRDMFNVKSTHFEIEQVIVIQYNEMRFGLVVDYVIGEYQAVLKSLGKIYKKQEIISGATILGDGTVALVIDPNKVVLQVANQMIYN